MLLEAHFGGYLFDLLSVNPLSSRSRSQGADRSARIAGHGRESAGKYSLTIRIGEISPFLGFDTVQLRSASGHFAARKRGCLG